MTGGFDIALWALLVIASVTDLRWGKIFNKTTLPFLLFGLAARFALGGSQAGLTSILAVLAAFALFFPLYLLKALAAGDVKLLMAVGAWTTPAVVFRLAFAAIVIGAIVGVVVLATSEGWRGGLGTVVRHLRGTNKTSHRMPFGPAFLCGFFVLKIVEMYRWDV